MTLTLTLSRVPFALKTLEIYTKADIDESIEQLNQELQELGMKAKIGGNLQIIKKIFKIAKKELGSLHPSISDLLVKIESILYYEVIPLSSIVKEEEFKSLKNSIGEEKSYRILAWGIIKYYVEVEKIREAYIEIKYDP